MATRSFALSLMVFMLLLISVETVNANPIPIPPPKEEAVLTFLALVSGIFLFNYLINFGSAALTFKVFGFTMDISSINKLAVVIFKVTIAGTFLVFLIHGTLVPITYGFLKYSVSAIIVGGTEIILLSFLLHGLYRLEYKIAVSVSVCAITFGALIGLPLALMLI